MSTVGSMQCKEILKTQILLHEACIQTVSRTAMRAQSGVQGVFWPCSMAQITAAGGSADVGCVTTPLCCAEMLTAYMALLSQLISCHIPAVLSGGEADRQPVCGLKPADQRSVFLVL